MSVTVVRKGSPSHSLSWFSETRGGNPVPVSLAAYSALLGEPGAADLPVAELLEGAAVNAADDAADDAAWRAEALLSRLTPTLLADMTADPSDDTEVTRQVPLSANQSVEVTVHRESVNADDLRDGWLFQQLVVASF